MTHESVGQLDLSGPTGTGPLFIFCDFDIICIIFVNGTLIWPIEQMTLCGVKAFVGNIIELLLHSIHNTLLPKRDKLLRANPAFR